MQTSLTEIKDIEQYLNGSSSADEKLLFQAKLILDPNMAINITYQEKTYHLIEAYGREQLKLEIDQVEKILFTKSTFLNFRNKISKIFK